MARTVAVGSSGNAVVDGLLSGVRWAEPIDYFFANSPSDYGSDYGGTEPRTGFATLNAAQRTAASELLDADFGSLKGAGFSVEGLTNLDVSLAGGNAASEVTFGQSSEASPTAYAYYPSPRAIGGDVWIGTQTETSSVQNPVPGNYAYQAIGHEIGHAVGLKHGHEDVALPRAFDSTEYSIMTYRDFVGDDVGGYSHETNGLPQSFMIADIAALQHMYGADYGTNAGNTVYSWNPGSGNTVIDGVVALDPAANRIFATIWDGGGNDTYNLAAYSTDLQINLNPGEASLFSSVQQSLLGEDASGARYASGNIYNALLHNGDTRSLIENAIGGSGADRIVGNVGNNGLTGGTGNDSLFGAAGSDVLDGGLGDDLLFGGTGSDRLDGGDGRDQLFAGDGADRLFGGRDGDVLGGGTGNDRLDGEDGNDILYAGAGFDIASGAAGNDLVFGGANDDEAFGGTGNDTVYAGVGNDTIGGGDGADVLGGGAGNDRIFAGVGNDTIYAGGGSDIVYGGLGADVIYFGPDGMVDTYGFAIGDGQDRLFGFEAANDRLDLSASGLSNASEVDAATVYGPNGTAVITLDDGSTLTIDAAGMLDEANFVF